MSSSLWPHGLQHARLLCPSPTPGACTNSCPLSGWVCPWSQWYHPTFLSSVIPFSSCLQSFSALGSFPMSQFFASSGQSIRASASTSVLPVNIQDWFPLGLTGLIYLQSNELSEVFSSTIVWKMNHSVLSHFYGSILTSVHDYVKNIALTIWTLVDKVTSLPFNMLSRLVIAFLLKSNCLHPQWFWSQRK